MTVFVWSQDTPNPDTQSKQEFATTWAQPTAHCLFCDSAFMSGDRVWHWHIDGQRDLRAHTACVAKHACGILKDIGECLR